jgi:hypothetical protein
MWRTRSRRLTRGRAATEKVYAARVVAAAAGLVKKALFFS